MFYFSHGVRLSPLGSAATVWPTVPAPDDRWWLWSNRWNANWQGKPKYCEKTCPSATLSTTNPIWPDLGWYPGRRGGKPATNRLSYGTAPLLMLLHVMCVHVTPKYRATVTSRTRVPLKLAINALKIRSIIQYETELAASWAMSFPAWFSIYKFFLDVFEINATPLSTV
jgi:hypothetical protein